ncbi:Hypothetical predicted protein [Mytilus galloprovincialis]|uniref:Peptidase aspartic putative domain-containing protein n=1 Tax=Mytilus galloprovincialis TaxID=29158 RepID=A0A8B6H7F0_MYTGA|nr:Hypothetical predicted protein [Mytilus galloprovincialis]
MAKLKEEQRKAELLAREKSLDEKKFIEEEKLKLRFKEEALEIKTELQVTDAKTRVIEELERSMLEDQQLEQIMVKAKNNIIDYNTQYLIARELNKPKADIQKFDGSPMNYKGFMRQFNARVETNTDSFEERINFLLQFTIGEPHRIVLGFSHLDAKIGYTAALNEFKDRYGDPDIIAHSYVQRAMNWPFIKADHPKALDDFAIFLQEWMYAVNYVDAVKVLEYSENLKLLIQKLPFYMQEKWRNVVYETKSRKNIVTFSHLVEFVKKEAKKANDPVYGKDVLNTQVGKNVKRLQDNNMKYRSPGSKTAVTVTSEPKASTSSVGQQNETSSTRYRNAFSKPCIYCENATHSLDKCDKVIKQSLKDRYLFLKSKGLCFSCLKYGHQKMSCRQKSSCTVCRKEHPSILHVEPRDQNQTSQQSESDQCPEVKNSTTFMGAGNSLRQALPILPVRVKPIISDNYIETYAFLDTGSTATFCTENIIRSLNIEGKKTKLSLVTMGQSAVHDCYVVTGLEISNFCGNDVISLPPVFSQETLPVTSNDIVFIEDIQKWSHLRDIPLQRIESEHIGLLIGINVPKAMEPWNVVPSIENGPFAVETLLGWVINGPLNVSTDDKPCKVASCNRIDATSVSLEDQIRNQFNYDFSEKTIDDVVAPSKEDRRFLELVSESIMLKDGHYVVNLPFKSKDNKMPNNRRQAEQRLMLLARRFERDETFRDEYVTFMNKVIGDGFATEVSIDDLAKKDNDVWFLPHHGVFHPRKKKIRVVFDCAAKFQGTSLNERLLQGPNLTNTLIGTLIRFRQDEIAIMGDIDSMFHQVRVPSNDANYLRFLWWQGGDVRKKSTEYQMNVHLFGATSSPSCVNFALRQTSEDCNGQFNDEVINTVLRNFYVDDCLKSTKNVSEAVCLVQDLQSLLSRGGFRIAKWISNNREVMRSIPISDMAVGIKDLHLDQDTLPIDRALGIQWCAETDTFWFKISVKEQPKTRRGILSMVSSVYDHLGFLAPFVLRAKMILQELCRLRLDWDDPIPPKLESLFSLWFQDLHELSDFKVDRCFRPEKNGEIKNAQLHHFSDASESGYGTVTYLRLENTFDEIHCSFVMGKARVTPLKTITVPRLELTAATVAVRTNKMLLNELEIPIDRSIFWTDNEDCWPKPSSENHGTICADDPEVKQATVRTIIKTEIPDNNSLGVEKLIAYFSSWMSLKRSVAWILKIRKELLRRVSNKKQDNKMTLVKESDSKDYTKRISLQELKDAEHSILVYVQRQEFTDEINTLSGNKTVKATSNIRKLDPVLDGDLLRVGGRLIESKMPEKYKHPIILPKGHHISELILRQIHMDLQHSGRNHFASSPS